MKLRSFIYTLAFIFLVNIQAGINPETVGDVSYCFDTSNNQSGPCSSYINAANQFSCMMQTLKIALQNLKQAYDELNEYNKAMRKLQHDCLQSSDFKSCLKEKMSADNKYAAYCSYRWSDLKNKALESCSNMYQSCLGCNSGQGSSSAESATTCLNNQCDNNYKTCINPNYHCSATKAKCIAAANVNCGENCKQTPPTPPTNCGSQYTNCIAQVPDSHTLCYSQNCGPQNWPSDQGLGPCTSGSPYQNCMFNQQIENKAQVQQCLHNEQQCQDLAPQAEANFKNQLQQNQILEKECLTQCVANNKVNQPVVIEGCKNSYNNCMSQQKITKDTIKPECEQTKNNCLSQVSDIVSGCGSQYANCKQQANIAYSSSPSQFWTESCELGAPYLSMNLINSASNFYGAMCSVINYLNNQAGSIPGVEHCGVTPELTAQTIYFCSDGSEAKNGSCSNNSTPIAVTYYKPENLLKDQQAMNKAGKSLAAISQYFQSNIHLCFERQIEKEKRNALGIEIGAAIGMFVGALLMASGVGAALGAGLDTAIGATEASAAAAALITALVVPFVGVVTFVTVTAITVPLMIGVEKGVQKIIQEANASLQVTAKLSGQ